MKQKHLSTDLHRLCACYVILLFSLFLFFLPQGGYAAITRERYPLFLLLHVGFLTAAGVLALLRRKLPGQRLRAVSPGQWAALGYLLFTGLSAVFSAYSGTFLGNTRKEGLLTILLYVGTALVLSEHLPFRPWMLHLAGAAVTVFCLLGMVQFSGANPFGLYPAGYDYFGADVHYAGKYWSAMGNAGLCGGFLAMAAAGLFTAVLRKGGSFRWLLLPAGLSVFSLLELENEAGLLAVLLVLPLLLPVCVRTKKQLARGFFALSALLLFAGLSLCLSISAQGCRLQTSGFPVLMAAILPMLAAILLDRCRWEPAPDKLRGLLALILAAALLLALAVVFLCDTLPGFLSEAHQLLRGNWSDQFGSGRLYIWRRVSGLVPEHWLLGGGPDTLSLRGLSWKPTYQAHLGMEVITRIDAAHNELLNILVNQGLPAVLCYLTMLLWAAFRWWKSAASDGCAICGAAAAAYVVQSFFGISMFLCAPYFWLALAPLLKGEEHRL
ncbi:MAG: O-antigen ligase family protein [Clostridia bacterium]|nr:O-antigen ligase family protein [Clostridia bacterium]